MLLNTLQLLCNKSVTIPSLSLSRRMLNFENDLCTTVDAILEMLGHKPKVAREMYQVPPTLIRGGPLRPQRIDLSQAYRRPRHVPHTDTHQPGPPNV